MPRRKRPSNNPAGRPVTVGGTEAAVVLSVRIPAALREQAQLSAERAGLTVSEWWRRAGYTELGVLGADADRLEPVEQGTSGAAPPESRRRLQRPQGI